MEFIFENWPKDTLEKDLRDVSIKLADTEMSFGEAVRMVKRYYIRAVLVKRREETLGSISKKMKMSYSNLWYYISKFDLFHLRKGQTDETHCKVSGRLLPRI